MSGSIAEDVNRHRKIVSSIDVQRLLSKKKMGGSKRSQVA